MLHTIINNTNASPYSRFRSIISIGFFFFTQHYIFLTELLQTSFAYHDEKKNHFSLFFNFQLCAFSAVERKRRKIKRSASRWNCTPRLVGGGCMMNAVSGPRFRPSHKSILQIIILFCTWCGSVALGGWTKLTWLCSMGQPILISSGTIARKT